MPLTLASVTSGRRIAPLKVVLYAPEGAGKSTFASHAPSPIFLASEDGTDHLDVARFPKPETWAEVEGAVDALLNEPHEYRTLVVDTLDWLEPLLHKSTCKREGWRTIEAAGYGKGEKAACEDWRAWLARLDVLRAKRGMHVLLLAHAQIKAFKNPDGEDFDRWQMKLEPKASATIREWAECVLFGAFKDVITKEKGKRAKARGGAARIMYTERSANWDAKNRLSLPPSMPLDWESFYERARAGCEASVDAGPVRNRIEGLIQELVRAEPDETIREKRVAIARSALERAGSDIEKLALTEGKLRSFLADADTRREPEPEDNVPEWTEAK